MSTTVTWVLDANSKYEISSKDHLIQLMHTGTLYTNAGTPPSDFNQSDYIQTVDIDLQHDANIQPIGTNSSQITNFEYDGANHTISNWTYIDPNFETGNANEEDIGLFGRSFNSDLKNIRLTGKWVLRGFNATGGFLIGISTNDDITNIECDLAPGSEITQDNLSSSFAGIGGIIGSVNSSSRIFGLTLRGELSITPSIAAGAARVGGIIGNMGTNSSVTLARNLATFPKPITGNDAGGCIGLLFRGNASKIMSVMQGDIIGRSSGGGVIGHARIDRRNSHTIDGLICSMKGNITDENNSNVGGLIGFILNGTATGNTVNALLNYMSGNLNTTTTSDTRVGGTVGNANGTLGITNSIVAMNGFTQNSVFGSTATSTVDVTINTDFGMTFDIDNHSTTEPVTGLPTDASYFDLPFVELTGTDVNGVVYNWEFIFGNERVITLVPRPLNIIASFDEVSGAVGYRVTIQQTSTNRIRVVSSGSTDLEYNIKSLRSDTEYTVSSFSTLDGITYEPYLQGTVATLPNSSENYDVQDFRNTSGVFDLSESQDIYGLMDELFTTGDSINVALPGRITKTARFVRKGETASVVGEDALVVQFDTNSGSSQTASFTISDDSTLTMTFDETNETIEIDGNTFSPGNHTIIDGRKVTFTDI